jgi:para-nitrobenzyl esterase
MDVRRRAVVRLADWLRGISFCAGLRGPAAVVLLAGAISGCTVAAPDGAAPLRYRDVIFPTLKVTSGLRYGEAPDLSGNPVKLTLDMYRPARDKQARRPAIVLVHGGSFVGGTSTDSGVVKLATAFAQRGYVAVSINYRLLGDKEKCGQEDPPSQACVNAVLAGQHDAQAAVRWLRANASRYRIDRSRIAIEGTSAGAGIALAVAVNSRDPGSSGNPGHSSRVGAAVAISADFPHSLASSYFDPGDSPIQMFNGTADPVVPFPSAAQTAADLSNAQIPVIFEPLEGAGHVPFSTYGPQMITQSVYFCYDFLDLAHAAGQPASAGAAFDRQIAPLLKHNPKLGVSRSALALARQRLTH